MKITVQIAIQSDEGQTAVFQEVACLMRGVLRPDTLGLSLAEARSILAGVEQTMAERQAAELRPERTSPELAYLETKFAALVSYGLTVKLLREVLPIAEDLNTAAIQMQVHR